jgi:hypothetical protein
VLKTFGVPEQINVKESAQQLKNSINIKELLDNYLPGSYELYQTIRNNASANIELGLYSTSVAILFNLKLEGLGQFADLVL